MLLLLVDICNAYNNISQLYPNLFFIGAAMAYLFFIPLNIYVFAPQLIKQQTIAI